jgi:hypothetical protein
MATKRAIKTLWVIAALFAISSSAILYGQGQEPPGNPTQSAPLSPSDLQALVAPIATSARPMTVAP